MKSVFHKDVITLNSTKCVVIRQFSSRYLFWRLKCPKTRLFEVDETLRNFCRLLFLLREGLKSIKCTKECRIKEHACRLAIIVNMPLKAITVLVQFYETIFIFLRQTKTKRLHSVDLISPQRRKFYRQAKGRLTLNL